MSCLSDINHTEITKGTIPDFVESAHHNKVKIDDTAKIVEPFSFQFSSPKNVCFQFPKNTMSDVGKKTIHKSKKSV
jgi:hypothetical protein